MKAAKRHVIELIIAISASFLDSQTVRNAILVHTKIRQLSDAVQGLSVTRRRSATANPETLELIAQIKSRLPIMEALRRYTNATPKQKGNSFWCSCLQKQENVPSMQLFPDRDKYRCFSCRAHGDQIDLVSEAMSLTLPETLELLAKDLGIDGEISAEERRELEEHRQARDAERQRTKQENKVINDEYERLVGIEKLMYSFLLPIRAESDLDREEVAMALRCKDELGSWIDVLHNGTPAEKLALVEQTSEWVPWR